ncbi:MAG: ketose-bisphosphate aldolase [Caldibacillus debilis]|uniref:class II fructose-bisphosphate aldolase n=1 Tax=Caldibacillus debilis TaxID=301148 RepID=UPI000E3AF467|nr:class II fructose-bisphosphate aldolase [Caldibacillus debilis]REJ14987.1 MAG: ketose-bisphosphate aldolase [Caldibacillus debilis]
MKNLASLFEKNNGKGAIGAFNVHCLEMLPSIMEAAKELNVPIILQTSLGTAEYIGFDLIVSSVKTLSERYNIDACLHLDHCKDIDAIKKAIDSGYTSVMYDGSSLPLSKNIENTKIVVEYAHNRNVSVEGEVGTIGGAEDEFFENQDDVKYTNPDDACRFVQETQVDALAVAIGTAHGQYKSKAKINFDLLKEISSKIRNVGLVLHGGTGVSDEDLKRCVYEGVKKVNIGSELNKAYIEEINKTFPSAIDNPLTSLRNLFTPANYKIKEIVKQKITLLQK